MTTIATIVEIAARHFEVSPAEVLGKSRLRGLVEPRFAAIFIARRYGMSLTQIGWNIGRRDHTTVYNAIRQAEKWKITKPDFRERLSAVQAEVRQLLGPVRDETVMFRSTRGLDALEARA